MSTQQDDNLLDLGWIVSLLFWLCLLTAALLFGALVLTPKLEVYWGLQKKCHENQLKLVALEEQINHLTRVAEALEHDPEYQTQVARVDLKIVEAGAERVAMDVSLNMSANVPSNLQGVPASTSKPNAESKLSILLQDLSTSIVHDQVLRRKLYLILAGVIVFAFVFLQDRGLVNGADE